MDRATIGADPSGAILARGNLVSQLDTAGHAVHRNRYDHPLPRSLDLVEELGVEGSQREALRARQQLVNGNRVRIVESCCHGGSDAMIARLLIPLTLFFIYGCALASAREDSPPSYVIILADDLGWADVSCQGSLWQTPSIDALAADGIRFTRAASNGPNCAPSRACLLTGTDVAEHGIFTVRPSARGKAENRKLTPPRTEHALTPEALTIAEMLAGKGYRSAFIGKWHLGEDPALQGFDVSIAGNQRGATRKHLAPWNLPGLPEQADGTPLADALTDHAVKFIEDNAAGPFLLMLSHYAVHTPIQAPPAEIASWAKKLPDEPNKRHRYAAVVDSVDRSVGRVRKALEENGCANRTLLIFTSDNGGVENFHRQRTASWRQGETVRGRSPGSFHRLGSRNRFQDPGTRCTDSVIRSGANDAGDGRNFRTSGNSPDG